MSVVNRSRLSTSSSHEPILAALRAKLSRSSADEPWREATRGFKPRIGRLVMLIRPLLAKRAPAAVWSSSALHPKHNFPFLNAIAGVRFQCAARPATRHTNPAIHDRERWVESG